MSLLLPIAPSVCFPKRFRSCFLSNPASEYGGHCPFESVQWQLFAGRHSDDFNKYRDKIKYKNVVFHFEDSKWLFISNLPSKCSTGARNSGTSDVGERK